MPSGLPANSSPSRPFWYEEPVLAENLDALAAAKRAINIPVVTGEELYTKFEFREVFEKQAADIINPDVCNVGGILELKEIAAMAEPYFVGRVTAQLQQHRHRAGSHPASVGLHSQFPHHRVLRQSGILQSIYCHAAVCRRQWLHSTSRSARIRH